MPQQPSAFPAFQEIVLRHSADAALLLHPNEGVVYASPACEHVIGIPADRFLGLRAADWVHPDDVDAAIEQRRLAALDGHSGPTLIRGRHGGGTFQWFEAEWWHLVTEHTVLHLRNVDRQGAAIAATVRDLALLTAALEHLGTVVLHADPEGSLQILANGWRALGWTHGVTPPIRWGDLVHPDHLQGFAAVLLGAQPTARCSLATGRPADWADWDIRAVDLRNDPRVGAVLLYATPAS